MRLERVFAPLLLAGAASCGGQKMPETRPLPAAGSEVEINQVMETALEADAAGETADSLYAPYATVIADGRPRRGAPRFAGITEDGEVAITSTRLQSRGAAAWGDLEYRWISTRSNRARTGLATFVLTPAQSRAGWWIVQLHSSTGRSGD
jgi:hypothetical protein